MTPALEKIVGSRRDGLDDRVMRALIEVCVRHAHGGRSTVLRHVGWGEAGWARRMWWDCTVSWSERAFAE